MLEITEMTHYQESLRWIEGYERVAEMAERCPDQRLIYVTDREVELLDLVKKTQQLRCPSDWLIRARHNRKISAQEKRWDVVDKQDALAKITFLKPRKKGEKSRQVLQEVKVLKYTLSPKSKHPISVTRVQAKELNPPKGKSPIVWRIMTHRDILNESQAIEIIDGYR